MSIKGLVIALLIGFSSGCASRAATPVSFYYPKKIQGLEIIKTSIETRNNTIEGHPQWRMIASQRILLRSLEDIPQSIGAKPQTPY